MTETFAIGRASMTSPFREETLTGPVDFAPPAEPEFSPPDEGEDLPTLLEPSRDFSEESFLGGQTSGQAVRAVRAALTVQGQSSIAVQAARQWNAGDRPPEWIGNVYGLVVHTTGGGLPTQASAAGIYHTAYAVDWYNRPDAHGCHYVNGWRGVAGGDLLQIANERERANGVSVAAQRRSIDQGRFEKDLPASVVARWRARWPGVEHPLRLLPGTTTSANACYVHLECVPCVFAHNIAATPMRPGLRFTKAQHEAVALLACDIARRNGWPLRDNWWRSPRLLGHEDLSPITRLDNVGAWDPGALRASPFFDWDFVYAMIERECRAQPPLARPPWWPFSAEAEDELFTTSPDHDLSDESEELKELDEVSEPEDEEWEDDGELEEDREDEGALENALEDENGFEGESSFLEPFRIAMAVVRGQRDEKALTNSVFFARHPELDGRAIAAGEKALAAEWIDIRDRLIHPLLARASAAPAAVAPADTGGTPDQKLHTTEPSDKDWPSDTSL